MTSGSTTSGLSVIKIGGSVSTIPAALTRVCGAVGRAGRLHRLLVVPGGGPFAQTVREFDRATRLSPDSAHWMAILAMDQYAHVLAEQIPDAVVIDDPGDLPLARDRVPVLAPSRWMRAADVLPHSWEVTSDSIAAFVAGALDAERLILIKAVGEPADPVDPYFSSALPRGMPYWIVGSDRLEELLVRLSD